VNASPNAIHVSNDTRYAARVQRPRLQISTGRNAAAHRVAEAQVATAQDDRSTITT
jgi:hypothetical protein